MPLFLLAMGEVGRFCRQVMSTEEEIQNTHDRLDFLKGRKADYSKAIRRLNKEIKGLEKSLSELTKLKED